MKYYLGDSVYAEFDGYGITLTTENGFGPSNTIFLDLEVLTALNQFVSRVTEQKTQQTKNKPQKL